MSENQNSKEYEMSYFLKADVPEDKLENASRELNSLIAESGGSNIALEIPKRKRLSYPIKKQSEGYFGVAYFNINVEGLEKIKKSLALDKKFLRYTVLNKPLKPKPADVAPATVKLNSEPVSEPMQAPAQSFDQKLENILNR